MIPMFLILFTTIAAAFVIDGAAAALTSHRTVCTPCTDAQCDESAS
jgi:hypothetical protein